MGNEVVRALNGVNLKIFPGEFFEYAELQVLVNPHCCI
jgi:hypothetical protein